MRLDKFVQDGTGVAFYKLTSDLFRPHPMLPKGSKRCMFLTYVMFSHLNFKYVVVIRASKVILSEESSEHLFQTFVVIIVYK